MLESYCLFALWVQSDPLVQVLSLTHEAQKAQGECKIIQMEKHTWVLTETLLKVQLPQQRSEVAILQCIELTSAVEG